MIKKSDHKDIKISSLTLGRLSLIIYIAGYSFYLVPALIWGWVNNVDIFLGFAAWQIFIYAPLWPIVLFAQFYNFIIPLL